MKIYTIHIKPDEASAYEKPLFVREGWNFWAFLFPFFWAIYEKLWLRMLFVLGVEIALMVVARQHLLSPISMGVVQMGFHFWVGMEGNDWIRTALTKRGYIMADIVTSDSLLRAQQRYFERYVATA